MFVGPGFSLFRIQKQSGQTCINFGKQTYRNLRSPNLLVRSKNLDSFQQISNKTCQISNCGNCQTCGSYFHSFPVPFDSFDHGWSVPLQVQSRPLAKLRRRQPAFQESKVGYIYIYIHIYIYIYIYIPDESLPLIFSTPT